MRRSWVLVVLFAVGCVSRSSYDQVVADRDRQVMQLQELEGRIGDLERETEHRQKELEALHQERELAQEKAANLAEVREVLGLRTGPELEAVIRTGLGPITCELWPDIAPVTVQNFVQLAEGTREWTDPKTGQKRSDPLYSGTVFHRVIPKFMIQGGDPLGNGRGGPGYRFEDEVMSSVTFDEPGLLAMANAGPNTNGSQFFITDSTPTHLNGRHTIFGKCDLDVVRKILAQPRAAGPGGEPSRPKNPVKITRIEVRRH